MYRTAKTRKVIDKATGEEKIEYEVDLKQYEQVTQVYDDALQKYVFYDQNGNVLPDVNSDDDVTEAPPKMKRKRRPKKSAAPPAAAPPRSAPKAEAERQPELKESELRPPAEPKEEGKETLSRPASTHSLSSEEKGGVRGLEQLQREVDRLRAENESLKRQLLSSPLPGARSVGLAEEQMLCRLDQNHRLLRYLQQFADGLPAAMRRNALETLSEFESKPRAAASGQGLFGVSLFHLMLIMALTVLLVFWETTMAGNNLSDDGPNVIDSALEFAHSLCVMTGGYLPPGMWEHTATVVGYAQSVLNHTVAITENIAARIT